MKKIIYILLFLPIIGLSQTTDLQSDTLTLIKQSSFSKVTNYLQQYNRDSVPGIAISIIYKGKVQYKEGFGMGDLEKNKPINTNTIFDLASIAKTFTGIGIAILEEEKRLIPSNDIRKYLPEFPILNETITVDHLIHQCSGLPDWVTILDEKGITQDDEINAIQIWEAIKRIQKLNFKPGDQYKYSNTNYFLLAKIIENVTDTAFHEWIQQRIFKPLGMKDSYIANRNKTGVKNLAKSYIETKDGAYIYKPDLLIAPGSSSFFSSIEDMNKFLIELQKQEIFTQEIYNRIIGPIILNDGSKGFYGYGIGLRSFRQYKYISHGGGWQGYRSEYWHFPDLELSMIILSNCPTADSFDIAAYITNILLEFTNPS